MTVLEAGKKTLGSLELAQMIDISAVQAFHAEADIRSLAEIATANHFVAAHALPHFVPLLRSLIPSGWENRSAFPPGAMRLELRSRRGASWQGTERRNST